MNNLMIYGPSQSGKSSLVRKLLQSYHDIYDNVFMFGGAYLEYLHVLGTDYVYHNVDNDVITDIIEFQKKHLRNNILFIFDDVMDEYFNTPLFNMLSSCSRHLRISLWFSLHNIKKISPTLRKNIRHFFTMVIDKSAIEYIEERSILTRKEIIEMTKDNEQPYFYFEFKFIRDK